MVKIGGAGRHTLKWMIEKTRHGSQMAEDCQSRRIFVGILCNVSQTGHYVALHAHLHHTGIPEDRLCNGYLRSPD